MVTSFSSHAGLDWTGLEWAGLGWAGLGPEWLCEGVADGSVRAP